MSLEQYMKYYCETKNTTELTRKSLALVLAGGEGSRLKNLTKWRAKPAVPFGGKYRIIDFTLSNCVNSGIRRIGVLAQYKSHSLIRHLQRAWSFMRAEIGEFVEILPAQQRTGKHWYQGTADALYQNLDIIRRHTPDYVIVLGGDHIYTMDYSIMLYQHANSGADVTVGCIEVPREEASGFGVMSIDENYRIIDFTEKPTDPEGMPDKPDKSLVSMGIYIFSREFLFQQLIRDQDDKHSSHDFGKDIIPYVVENSHVRAFPFIDSQGNPAYWRDVGTVESYWKANLELCDVEPELNLYNREWPIWTYQTQNPPAKFVFNDPGRRGEAIDSLISAGCIISGACVHRSVVFFGSRIHESSIIENSILLPKVIIGKNCKIQRTIIDKSTTIPDNTNIGIDLEADRQRGFHVTENGIVLVTPEDFGRTIHHIR